MKKSELVEMIEKAANNGYDDWSNEWSFKLYIYPLSSALITTAEWNKITDGGDGSCIIGKSNVNWLIKTISERLLDLVKTTKAAKANQQDFYLTVNSYGLVYSTAKKIGSVTVDFHIGPGRHNDLEVSVTRPREWKPL